MLKIVCLEERQAYIQLKILKRRGFYGGGDGTRRSFMPVRVIEVVKFPKKIIFRIMLLKMHTVF